MGRDGSWGRDEALVERRVGWMGISWSDSSEEGAKKGWGKNELKNNWYKNQRRNNDGYKSIALYF
jgi:hypothetical protein